MATQATVFMRNGGFMRPYASVPGSGRHTHTLGYGALPAISGQLQFALLRPLILTHNLGNTAPARNRFFGPRIRDSLAQRSLDNAVAPAIWEDRTQKSRSYSQMLGERLAAQQAELRADGWRLLSEGEYRRSIARFQAAKTVDRMDIEAHVGLICSAVIERAHSHDAANEAFSNSELADAVLAQLLELGSNPFGLDIDLREKDLDEAFLLQLASTYGRLARARSTEASVQARTGTAETEREYRAEALKWLAMHAFILWHVGDREEALRMADDLYERHRTTIYASMAAMMRGEDAPGTEAQPTDSLSSIRGALEGVPGS
jgi:hypothetical protein